jgi:hypothetical protein
MGERAPSGVLHAPSSEPRSTIRAAVENLTTGEIPRSGESRQPVPLPSLPRGRYAYAMGRPPRLRPWSIATAFALLAATGAGCSRQKPAPPGSASAKAGTAPSPSAPTVRSAGATPSAPAASPRPLETSVVGEAGDAGIPGLVLGELSDVGPAGPATAASTGVVMVTKDDRVLVAKRAPGRPERASFAPIEAPASDFAALGRGPGVARGHAYWVSRGRLVRHALEGEARLEVLTDDARTSSRATAVEIADRVAVAYVGRPDREGTAHARLWLEGGPSLDVTPEGAGASSVALTANGEQLLVTAIDGRSAMTPMHARTVRVGPKSAELGPDVVVWVGGPAQAWTETWVTAESGRAFAQVPIERDATHFGLANVDLGSEPRMDSSVTFFDYPNGIDLAPVSPAELCEKAHVAFVRPTTSTPRSPQELVLVRLGTNEAVTLANARGFASVSLAGVAGGGLVAYVADGRTWARGLGCGAAGARAPGRPH